MKMKKKVEYDLYLTNINTFKIVLRKQSKSEIKWLQFSDTDYFLLQGAILGSLNYDNYIFKLIKVNDFEHTLKIFDKKRKSFFSRKVKEIFAGNIFSNEEFFEKFIALLDKKKVEFI